MDISNLIDSIVERLTAVDGIDAVALGGSRARGTHTDSSDIDIGIYYQPSKPIDLDVKALLHMVVVWNIPIACNRASADVMIFSPLMDGEYERLVPDYGRYTTRKVSMNDEAGF